MVQLGQYPAPAHVLAHFSDTHFLGGDKPLFGAVQTRDNLVQALGQLERSGIKPEAIVFTGDLADLGEPDAYRRLREIVEPVAERLEAEIIWVMGNHDERFQFATELFDQAGTDEPQDRVYDINDLRIIAIDTTVPGYHHGEITDAQLEWLAEVLAVPAPHGTLLAMHHPPIPTPIEVEKLIELSRQDRLAAVIEGTDVRAILGGHLHYSTHSTFAGVPVSVASATCYTMDLLAPQGTLSGVNGAQAFNLVQVFGDRLVHSVIPVGSYPQVTGFSDTFLEKIEAMTPERRIELFSNKKAQITLAELDRTE